MAKKTNYNKKKQYPVRRLFNNLFNISQDEFPLVLLFFFYFTTIGLFYTIGVSAGEAMLLSRFNAIKIENLLPWLYIGIASVSVLIIWFYDILQNRIDRLKLIIVIHILMGVSVLFFRYLVNIYHQWSWLYYILVIWLESSSLLSIMLFFSYAGDYFTPRTARRLYGFMAGGQAFGTCIAGFLMSPLIHFMGLDNLLYIIAGLQIFTIVWTVFISHKGKRLESRESDPGLKEKKAPLNRIVFNPYIFFICLFLIASLICFRLVEYQFQIFVSRTYNESALAIFFGRFFGFLGVLQIIIQFIFVSRLLNRLGVIKCLLILPFCLLAASYGFYIFPTLTIVVVLNLVRLSLADTLELPTRELLFLPLDRRIRLRAQSIISGAIVPFGSGLGGILILWLVNKFSLIHQFSPVVIMLSAIWILAIIMLYPFYKKTLQSSLRSSKLKPIDVESYIPASGINESISKLLETNKGQKDNWTYEGKGRVLFALELINNIPRYLSSHMERVKELTRNSDADIAVAAIKTLVIDVKHNHSDILHIALNSDNSNIRAQAILTFAGLLKEKSVNTLINYLDKGKINCQLAANVSLIRFGGNRGSKLGYERLNTLLNSTSGMKRREAAMIIMRIGGRDHRVIIKKLLEDKSKPVRLQAVIACKELKDPELTPLLIQSLKDRTLQYEIIQALEAMPESAAPFISRTLNANTLQIPALCDLALVIGKIGGKKEIKTLLSLLKSSTSVLLEVASGRALRLAKKRRIIKKISRRDFNFLFKKMTLELDFINHAYTESMGKNPFVAELFFDRALLLLDILFSLFILRLNRRELDNVELNMLSTDIISQGNALELLELLLPGRIKRKTMPLLNRFFQGKSAESKGLTDETIEKLLAKDNWLRMAAIFYKGKRNLKKYTGENKMSKKDMHLFNIISTISFLKSVALFKNVPSEYLTSLAEIAKDRTMYKNEILFKDKERGDSLYLIRSGSISVRKGRREVAILGPKECIGEMALIDSKPRSATCVIIEDARLLRISSADFSRLIDTQPVIAKALLHTLAQRLRKMSSKA